jgi:hypothetical protein
MKRESICHSVHVLSISFVVFAVGCLGGPPDDEQAGVQVTTGAATAVVRVPGLVMGLLHNQNQTSAGTVMYSAYAYDATHRDGGDLGAANHRGYEWWSLPDTGGDPATYHLPPGVVVALKHNATQSGQVITAFGHDATTGSNFTNFTRQNGGDRGASSGVGYFWYESTGAGFTDWASVDAMLPKYTVVGLKHSMNQSSKVLVWNGVTYDPVQTSPVPPGFRRMAGGDMGAPNGQGYFWYEKTTGSEIVTRPTLYTGLGRSIFMGAGDAGSLDKDGDCLVDVYENVLATSFRPEAVYDSSEHARQSFEPVTLYRVYPISSSQLHVRYEFVMALDGGYGPSSWCGDGHPGDTDNADYDLYSSDGGQSWWVGRVALSDQGAINWPGSSRLEVYNVTFPILYMSGSKHHEYLTRDNDEHNSAYSDYGCNDDIDGMGAHVLVASVGQGMVSNNVGETLATGEGAPYPAGQYHPVSRFANTLPMFPIPNSNPVQYYAVWDNQTFEPGGAGTIDQKFPTVSYPSCPNGCPHGPCRTGAPLAPGCFSEVASLCASDPYCCNNWWDYICVAEVPSGCQ